jgi:hypothetical protein
MRKVLPPVTDGAFDVFTGEAFLEPPVGDIDPTVATPLAEEAVAEVVDNRELDAQLNQLARQLQSLPPVEELPTVPADWLEDRDRADR